MGNSPSQPITADTKGYHVLKVKETSPAHKAGLEPYFDFIVAVNDQRFPGESTILTDTIKGSINKDVKLTVFNSKNQSYRDVILVPYFWREPKDGLIGCSIRFCDYNGASEHVWHVVEVLKNSPAESAGLQPNSDYIVGCPDVLLYSQNDFFKLIQERAAQNQPVRMFVYSSTTDSIREILLLPNTNWGGEGLIGAQLGYGALHRIPSRPAKAGAPTASTETQYQTVGFSAPTETPNAQAVVPPQASQAPSEQTTLFSNSEFNSPVPSLPTSPPNPSTVLNETSSVEQNITPVQLLPTSLPPQPVASGKPSKFITQKPVSEQPSAFANMSAPPTDEVLQKLKGLKVQEPAVTASNNLFNESPQPYQQNILPSMPPNPTPEVQTSIETLPQASVLDLPEEVTASVPNQPPTLPVVNQNSELIEPVPAPVSLNFSAEASTRVEPPEPLSANLRDNDIKSEVTLE